LLAPISDNMSHIIRYVANKNLARAYLHIRDVPFRVALDVKTGLATFSWH
jgi:hypothetical protein